MAADRRDLAPERALERLMEGNRRFVADEEPMGDVSRERRLSVAREQHPFATLVGCSDSRVGPEQLFGVGLGDLFIVRSAGGVVDDVGVGSIEFAAAKLGVRLIVVLGHEACGAVTAAIDRDAGGDPRTGALGLVVDRIVPAVRRVREVSTATGDELVDLAVRENVNRTVAALRGSSSEILAEPIRSGHIGVVGAYYDLGTGGVEIINGLDV